MEGKREAGDVWCDDEGADDFEVTGHLHRAPKPTRETRVSQIRALVRSGRYEVDATAVAEAMLKRPVISALLRAS